jgi:hypothetical protein
MLGSCCRGGGLAVTLSCSRRPPVTGQSQQLLDVGGDAGRPRAVRQDERVTYALSLHVPGFTSSAYEAVVQELADQQLWPPPDRISHTCSENGDGVDISEVWESRRAAEQFMARIFGILDRQDLRVLHREP